uniref:BPTI/Kunitz inhibitor domain-containing protein n=1 Tax=Crocodylus porosus TaxID=8502 RepID=A0A7M4ENJ8_CROPO
SELGGCGWPLAPDSLLAAPQRSLASARWPPRQPRACTHGNDTCTHDRDCPKQEKCCFGGCFQHCLPRPRDICRLPPDPGPCLAAVPRWFYHWPSGRCRKFEYGSCSGNANNFETKHKCLWACSSLSSLYSLTSPPPSPYSFSSL